jgi:hypothetical protein
MTTGLGINAMPNPDDAGESLGRLPRDERRVIAAQFPNTGVLNTPTIATSASALTYTVGSNVVVASRGVSDGSTIFPVDEATVTIAATAGNPRIDVIYAYQHDYEQGDADNKSGYGVVQGTASASPTEPDVPANTQRVAAMRLPANASTTTGATQVNGVIFAIPYSGGLGVLKEVRDTATDFGGDITVGSISFYLPTDRQVRFEMVTTAVAVLANVGTPLSSGSLYQRLSIDGVVVRELERGLTGTANTELYAELFTLSAGQHTASMRLLDGTTGWKRYYGPGTAGRPGQLLRAIDEGVAR